MDESCSLAADRLHQLRMAVAYAVHRYAGDEVQVFPAFAVPNMSTASLDEEHVLAAVGLEYGFGFPFH